MKNKISVLAVFAMVLGAITTIPIVSSATPAQAAPVTVTFHGTLTNLIGSDPWGTFPDDFHGEMTVAADCTPMAVKSLVIAGVDVTAWFDSSLSMGLTTRHTGPDVFFTAPQTQPGAGSTGALVFRGNTPSATTGGVTGTGHLVTGGQDSNGQTLFRGSLRGPNVQLNGTWDSGTTPIGDCSATPATTSTTSTTTTSTTSTTTTTAPNTPSPAATVTYTGTWNGLGPVPPGTAVTGTIDLDKLCRPLQGALNVTPPGGPPATVNGFSASVSAAASPGAGTATAVFRSTTTQTPAIYYVVLNSSGVLTGTALAPTAGGPSTGAVTGTWTVTSGTLPTCMQAPTAPPTPVVDHIAPDVATQTALTVTWHEPTTATSAQLTGVQYQVTDGSGAGPWTPVALPAGGGTSGSFTMVCDPAKSPPPTFLMRAQGPGGYSAPSAQPIPILCPHPTSNTSSTTTAPTTATPSTASTTSSSPSTTTAPSSSSTSLLPVACPNPTPAVTAIVGASFDFDPYSGAAHSGTSYVEVSPAGHGISVDAATGALLFRNATDTGGRIVVTAVVDGHRTCPLAEVTVTTNPANVVASVGTPQTVIAAPGPAGQTPTSVTGQPPSMTVNPANGHINWTPTAADKGMTTIKVTQGTSEAEVTFNVVTAARTTDANIPTTTSRGFAVTTPSAANDEACVASPDEIYSDMDWTAGSTLTIAPNIATRGTANSFTVTGGSLPEGMVLDNHYGVIAGTPSETGDYPLAVTASFADGPPRRALFTLSVRQAEHQLTYPTRVVASLGAAATIIPAEHVEGTTELTHTVVCGNLPDGMTLDETTGEIEGTPTDIEEYPIPLRIRSTEPNESHVDASFLLVTDADVAESLSYPSETFVPTGADVDIAPSVSGNSAPETFKVLSGELPHGLELDTRTGEVVGTAGEATAVPAAATIGLTSTDGEVVASSDLLIDIVATDSGGFNWWWVVLIAAVITAAAALVWLLRRDPGQATPAP